MATAPADTDKAEDENADRSDRSTRVFVSQAAIMPTHTSTATANIYTPLITPSHNAGASATLVSNNASQNSENDIIKTPVVIPKKQVSKTVTPLRSVGARGQRSSVKPFFCCGSELSLVSLVDGLELKDSHPKERKSNQIECQSSSEEEDSTPQSSRKSSGSSGHSVLYSGESRHTVVRRKKKDKRNVKKKFWSLRFRGRWNPRWRVSQPQRSVSHRCDLSFHNGSGCQGTYHNTASPGTGRRSPRARPASSTGQFIDLSRVQDFNRLYPVDDIDTIRLRERAEEMAAGVEVDPMSLNQAHRPSLGISGSMLDMFRRQSRLGSVISDSAVPSPDSPTEDYSLLMSNVVWQWQGSRSSGTLTGAVSNSPRIHTQVDFIHCLVPQLIRILACPFYWGVMDRYEAERLLDNKPEGTFLLRDSAQEDFLFSVSFRRYNRSLHARVEQWNHIFSFDAHDPAVFSAPTVCDLMEHYKDPCCCMFFEPMLTRPLPRNFPFTLQHICRAVICDRLVYDQIQSLPLPTSLKQFLQVYHYKQKVRVRRFDGPEMAYADTNLVVN